MADKRIEIDLDSKTLLQSVGLFLPPQFERDTPNGRHVAFDLTDFPDWVDDRGSDRGEEVLRLVRDVLAVGAISYDDAAPVLRPLNEHEPYRRYAAQQQATLSVRTVLSLVLGNIAYGADTSVTTELLSHLGYEAGAKYTREMCPFDDHISGGQGKGHCVFVADDGQSITCRGHHSSGTPKTISAARLLCQRGLIASEEAPSFIDTLLLWASRVVNYQDAIDGVYVAWSKIDPNVTYYSVKRTVAAKRASYLIQTNSPRVPAHKPKLPLYWHPAKGKVAQYLPHEHELDISIDTATRKSDFERAFPALWYEEEIIKPNEPTTYEWKFNGAALRGLEVGDIFRVLQAGIIPATCAAAPTLFGGTGWLVQNGLPVKMLLPPATARKPKTRDKAAQALRDLLDSIPVPSGMSTEHETALRLSYLLPALAESFLGQMPLVFFAGWTGSGKGYTVRKLQECWKWHFSGPLNPTEDKDLDNMLTFASKGGIFGLDELGATEDTSAVKPAVLARLKSVMTMDYYLVRRFHSQHFGRFRMAHTWFATGRSFSGVIGQLENDWRRRVVPIQFPSVEASQDYILDLESFADTFDPIYVINLIACLVEGLDLRQKRRDWAELWPTTMPGWQAVIGIAHEYLDITLDHTAFSELLQSEESAVECFRSFWNSLDNHTVYAVGKHSLSVVKEWAGRSATWRHFATGNTLASMLISQAASPDGNVRFTVGSGDTAGLITVYTKDKNRWTFKKGGDDVPTRPENPSSDSKGPATTDASPHAGTLPASASEIARSIANPFAR